MSVLDREGRISLGRSRLETAAQRLGEGNCDMFLAALAKFLSPERVEALYLIISDLDYLPPEARGEQVVEEIYRRFLREVRHGLNIDAALFVGMLNALAGTDQIQVRSDR